MRRRYGGAGAGWSRDCGRVQVGLPSFPRFHSDGWVRLNSFALGRTTPWGSGLSPVGSPSMSLAPTARRWLDDCQCGLWNSAGIAHGAYSVNCKPTQISTSEVSSVQGNRAVTSARYLAAMAMRYARSYGFTHDVWSFCSDSHVGNLCAGDSQSWVDTRIRRRLCPRIRLRISGRRVALRTGRGYLVARRRASLVSETTDIRARPSLDSGS